MSNPAQEAVRSAPRRLYHSIIFAPGLYPLKGVVYFLTHPFLYAYLGSRLLPATLISLFILVNLFLWTYVPQALFLAIWQGWHSAAFNATILVLGEGAAIAALLFEAFFVDETQVDIFDSILVAKDKVYLLENVRPVMPAVRVLDGPVDTEQQEQGGEGRLNPRQRLGRPLKKAEFAPFSLRQIVELVLLLPVNFIPWVGVPLFLFGTGYRAGPLLMWRYYTLRGMSRKERRAFMKRRRWSYAWFGISHLVLQLVPVLNMFFLLTTAAGAALYASDEEDRRQAVPTSRDTNEAYTDDPI